MSDKFTQGHSDNYSSILQMYPVLMRYCKAITSSPWEAEDLAQNTFIRWIKTSSRHDYQSISKVLLFQMASHTWIDHNRRKKCKDIPFAEFNHSEQNQIDRFDIENAIQKLVHKLTLQQCVILILHDVFVYKSREIAVLLNSTEGAIKSALYRARKTLNRDKNESELDDFPESVDEQEDVIQLIVDAVATHNPSILLNMISVLNKSHTSTISDIHFCLAAA